METEQHQQELLSQQGTTSPEQGEFSPITSLAGLLKPWQRPGEIFWQAEEVELQAKPATDPKQIPFRSVSLDTTGVTSQFPIAEFWPRQQHYRESIVAKLREAGAPGLAEPLAACHSRKGFAVCTGCYKSTAFWNRCDLFYCPTCQPRLAHERAKAIQWWAAEVTQPKHLVLTARNTNQISPEYVRWFKSCITKLRRSKLADKWRGGLWSLEVTNEGRGWHLHAHLLVDTAWIDLKALAIKWGNLVGQDYAIVYGSDARQTDYLKEVCKYSVKGSQLAAWSPTDVVAFVRAFTGQRSFGVFGSLFGRRKDYRAWLDSILATARICECGSKHFRVMDSNEHDWWQTTGKFPGSHHVKRE